MSIKTIQCNNLHFFSPPLNQSQYTYCRLQMGCFLACFGYTKKRNRPKSCNKIASTNHIHGSYVPLESDVFTEVDNTQKPKISEVRDNPKEPSSLKIKKKVSFNLNVKAYEPLQCDEIDGEEESRWEFNEEKTQRDTMMDERYKEDAIARNVQYPANYRYQNCRNSSDDEDEITIEDSDLDDDDEFDDEEVIDFNSNDENEDHNINQVKFCMFNSASAESDETVINTQLSEERMAESNHNVRHRDLYAYSVLNPVENLTQWKAIKARATMLKKARPSIMSEQENQQNSRISTSYCHVPLNSKPNLSRSKTRTRETAVDSSLSNWLV